jgi:hypothetical protein
MNFQKSLKVTAICTVLVVAFGCGNDKKHSSKSSRQAQDCSSNDNISCLSTVDWKISLLGKSFPSKARVEINGETVLNECVSKQQFKINRSAEPQFLAIPNYVVPAEGKVKIVISDMGADCATETEMIKENNAHFEVVKVAEKKEVHFNL